MPVAELLFVKIFAVDLTPFKDVAKNVFASTDLCVSSGHELT